MSYGTKKLKDVSIIKTGKLDSNAAVEGGEYPFFTCNPITLKINNWAYDTEAVLLAGNNASGNYTAKYYKGRFNAYQRTYIIETANKDELLVRFLCYAINQQLRLLKTMSSGSTTKFLTIRMLHGIAIPCPDIGTQNRIVNILGTIDDLIENNQKQIKLLEETAQRLYKEWFVDLRFPGYETTPVVDGVPEGWAIYNFSEKVDIMSGGTPKTDNANFYGGKIPFYTPKDSNGDFFALSTITSITEEGLNNCNSRLYPVDTVIITARGTVGKTTLLAVPMAMNQSCYALKSDELNAPYYLFFALNREIAALQAMANGGVFNTIIVKTFDSIKITFPRNNLIVLFENTVAPIMKQIKIKLFENQKLMEARDRLLPKLMSGEVEV